jgi:hypothetical protein
LATIAGSSTRNRQTSARPPASTKALPPGRNEAGERFDHEDGIAALASRQETPEHGFVCRISKLVQREGRQKCRRRLRPIGHRDVAQARTR